MPCNHPRSVYVKHTELGKYTIYHVKEFYILDEVSGWMLFERLNGKAPFFVHRDNVAYIG